MIDPKPSGRGGFRPGAGRKPAGYEKPPSAVDFDKAKARKEASLADMHELNYSIKLKQHLPREPIREGTATLLAAVAQGLRGLGDLLERKHNLTPEQAEAVDNTVNEVLGALADGLELLTAETN